MNMTAQSIDDRPSVQLDSWFDPDNTPVVQIDTVGHEGRLRINLNDAPIWDGNPETDKHPGAHFDGDHPSHFEHTISTQLDTIRDQADKIELLRAQLAETESESTEVIRKCNEQLSAMAAAAKLRDQQVETLARLWSAAFEQTGSPLGPVLTRQLYRVMADHGVDVSNMPDPV